MAGVAGEDAADVVQEVFRAVALKIHHFRRDRPGDSFRAWLSVITRNKLRDHFRRRAEEPRALGGTEMHVRTQEIQDLDLDSSTDAQRFDSRSAVVRAAVELVRNEFENKTWQAFWKTSIDGLATLEVAEQLGMSKWAVFQARSRILRRLRAVLEGMLD
jgi:RNA polymerase sigma-70 factor (ECF subfamily)